MNNFDPNLLSFFQKHALQFEYYEHKPIFTVEEGEDIKHTIPGTHTKNLFLTDKRGQYFLVCVESSKRLAISAFRKLVGAKDMSFWSPEEMMELLGLTPGSVSLFGLFSLFEKEGWGGSSILNMIPATPLAKGGLRLYLDKDLRKAERVWRHPNRNDATIVLDHSNLVKFLDSVGYRPTLLSLHDQWCQIVDTL